MAPKTRKTVQKVKPAPVEEVPHPRVRKVSAKVLESMTDVSASTPSMKKKNPSSPSTSKRSSSSSSAAVSALSKKLKASNPIITEQDIVSAENGQELIELINGLVNTKQDETFAKYKSKVQNQLNNDHQVIQELNADLLQRQETINGLLQEIKQLKNEVRTYSSSNSASMTVDGSLDESKEFVYESPIRKKINKKIKNSDTLISQDQLSKELENIGFTLDMLELLTGLRIVNFEEDESKYFFDVKQSGSNGQDEIYINYQLVISKSFATTAEINYIPTFLEALENDDEDQEQVDNANLLKEILPDYLCENLSFPYDTLSQFYSKVNRAVNKRTK
ncbi:CSM1-like protein [Scheffersomyces stipitis CBS 6054]|uniref:CSM1-like protein n=1 Tax=Scheffersomyces stipitis (strain ATCC 58785 / CBS 6054 / NBRC 10063 / NRRL Y-11545) TaxID=322104 RepID=A3GIE3_PICST|nr:CSM1-like protein [Scheffersomyces stipitis CBS 6054]EAZ62977.1 CSM1-like protein [Scheffersomyces stipitis CBS 6054]KAG2735579.1 hypothetical protein G9P44_001793 [Scheffersomyces stipitis]